MQPIHLLTVVMKYEGDDDIPQDMIERQRWACARALHPGVSFCVLNSSDQPVACFGFVDEDDGRCTGWLVTSSGWCCYLKSIAKAVKAIMKEGGYRRIQAFIRPDRPGAEKFVRWLGFEFDGALPKVAQDGATLNLYSYTQ